MKDTQSILFSEQIEKAVRQMSLISPASSKEPLSSAKLYILSNDLIQSLLGQKRWTPAIFAVFLPITPWFAVTYLTCARLNLSALFLNENMPLWAIKRALQQSGAKRVLTTSDLKHFIPLPLDAQVVEIDRQMGPHHKQVDRLPKSRKTCFLFYSESDHQLTKMQIKPLIRAETLQSMNQWP